jgi:hypothetical protein
MTEKNSVAKPSSQWEAQKPVWDLVNTLTGGTRAMRAAGTEYLPQEPKESEEAYRNRLSRSVLTPLYEDTLNKLIGKIMKQPVVLGEDVPASIAKYQDDIDAAGTDINEWTKRIGFWSMNHGVTYMLVDAPNKQAVAEREGRAVSRADVLKGDLRPYAVHVKAPQLLGFKTEVVDGQVRLTQARIYMVDEEDVPGDEFAQQAVERIHVWEIGRHRTYQLVTDKDTKEKEWMLEEDVTTDLDIIPLIPVYGKHVDFMLGTPTMLDIGYLNIAHWQSDSDQRHILHVARVPILFGSGLGNDERSNFVLEVGPNSMTRGPQGSDLKFVEHSGQGIEAGAHDLETLEQRIGKLGLNMVIKRQTGDTTATARALDQSESDSPLAMFARHLESQLALMLDLFGVILNLGEDKGGSITLYKDFSITMRDGDDITALDAMRARGDISQLTYWGELKRRNLLSDDFDPEREIDLLDLEYQDNQPGITGEEADAANHVGDETGPADDHTHILQANGWTNSVDGHRHKWEPNSPETSEGPDHEHALKASVTVTDRAGAKEEPATGFGQ